MPPSAMTGRRSARRPAAQSWTAVSCGTPTPATTRVVQIDPGPTPTLTASAPASISASGAVGGGDVAGHDRDVELRLTSFDHLDARRPSGRARCRPPGRRRPPPPARARSLQRVGAGPDRRADPQAPLLVLGGVRELDPLLDVLDRDQAADSRRSSSTTGSFSTRCCRRIACASSSVVPAGHGDQVLAGHHVADAAARRRRRSAGRGW